MHIDRVILLLVLVAVLCTPLTAVNSKRKNRRPHAKSRKQQFNANRIMEQNRTKTRLSVLGADSLGLPMVNPRPYTMGYEQSVLERAPQVNNVLVKDHILPLGDFQNNDFDKNQCHGANYKKDDNLKFGCEPRDTIVHLVHEEGLILSPNAVAVKRCDGGCTVHSMCIPVQMTNRTFYIRQIQNNQVTCGSIQVVEHQRCKCSCPERSSNCTPSQIYDQEECKCKCPSNVNQTCASAKMEFRPLECKCMCKLVKKCSTGSYFDHQKCSCPATLPLDNKNKQNL
ncbi:balbiani ring protein 3-like isoform X2 [Atheta coriaria]|uniref:balbiani ring protein 3-like isoform X2 n=1 Tax=Dalotia coriaria TaxID=877792 RepID=UPI0031F35B97